MNRIAVISKRLPPSPLLRELFDILLFMAITLVLHKLWWGWIWKMKELLFLDVLARDLAYGVFTASHHILDWLGVVHTPQEQTLYFETGSIAINSSCSGLKQIYQVFFLLFFFPGNWKNKTWFIPLGMLTLYLTNIFRIIVLSYIMIWLPEQWHFSHDWILRPFFYVVIFALWLIWLKRFSGRYAHNPAARRPQP